MTRGRLVFLLLVAAALALPPLLREIGETYYLGFAARVMIYGLAAQSLNLVVGTGGMVSFGHAAFVGLGAYAVAVLAANGIVSGVLAWPAAVALSSFAALIIGAISLRTRGVYFIMITLAFAQMLFFLAVSLKAYGGDDGLRMPGRSTLPGVDISGDGTFYHVTLLVVALAMAALDRIRRARFGRALEAVRDNEVRAAAVGLPVFRYRLAGFVIGGAFAGLAGALMANLNGFVAPANLAWQESGLLLVMVILGGLAHPLGGLLGAAAVLGFEEVAKAWTIHWPIGLGLVLLAVVLTGRRGIADLVRRARPA